MSESDDGACTHFSSLSGSPRELWFVYLLKGLESYAYFSFSVIFTIYLTDEFGCLGRL